MVCTITAPFTLIWGFLKFSHLNLSNWRKFVLWPKTFVGIEPKTIKFQVHYSTQISVFQVALPWTVQGITGLATIELVELIRQARKAQSRENLIKFKMSKSSLTWLQQYVCPYINTCMPTCHTAHLRRFDTFDCHKVVFAALTAFTVVFSITQ